MRFVRRIHFHAFVLLDTSGDSCKIEGALVEETTIKVVLLLEELIRHLYCQIDPILVTVFGLDTDFVCPASDEIDLSWRLKSDLPVRVFRR